MALSSAFQALLSIAVVSLAVLAIGSIITRSLRQPLERVRCIQWTLVALLFAVIIRQGQLLPEWPLNVLPSKTQTVVVDATSVLESRTAVAEGEAGAGYPHVPEIMTLQNDGLAASTPHAEPSIRSAASGKTSSLLWIAFQLGMLVVFAIGAAWSVITFCFGRWHLSQLVRASQLADDSMLIAWKDWPAAKRHGVRVRISEGTRVPMAFGVRKPVILIPRDLSGSDQQTIDYCLSHEWAHIKSHDVATCWAIQLMQPLLWFQPLFWFMQRELRTAQDQLADNFALKGQSDRSDYAALLMSLAKRGGVRINRLALTMADRRSGLYRRVELLLANKLQLAECARRRVTIGTIGCLALFTIGTGMLRLQPAIAETPSDPVAQPSLAGTETEGKVTETTSEKDEEGAIELSFSGKVIDELTEKPIEGATVVVRRAILKSYDRRTIEETTHQTDANGQYYFTIPREQTAEHSLYIELDVEHPDYAWWKGIGYSLGMIRKNLTLGAPPFFSKVILSPAEPVTGRILDPGGNPVPNTRMLAYCEKGRMDEGNDHGSFMRTSTDQNGRFRLQMAKQGASVFWIVPDEFSAVQIVSGSKRGDWGDITVKPGVCATGKVLSATGEPVADVWVNLEDTESQGEVQMAVASSMNRSAKTGADGTFKLGPMKEGTYSLGVSDYGQELTLERKHFQKHKKVDHVFVSQAIELAANDSDRSFTIQAKPHVEFHAQYLNSKGEPRSGHSVMIFGQFDGTWFHADVAPDKNGKMFGKLPRGLTDTKMDAITNEHSSVHVRLKKDGALMAGRQVDLGTLEDNVTGIEIIRYKAPIVQLKPVDELGNIIREGVKVSGVYTDGKHETMTPVGGAPTNMFFEKQDNGHHRSSQMLPDREAKFTVESDGYQTVSQKLQLPEGDMKELTFVLKKARQGDNKQE